jgi:hypothetical protein
MNEISNIGGMSSGLFFDGNSIRSSLGHDAGFLDGNVIRDNGGREVGFIHDGVVHNSGGREVGFVRPSETSW